MTSFAAILHKLKTAGQLQIGAYSAGGIVTRKVRNLRGLASRVLPNDARRGDAASVHSEQGADGEMRFHGICG